MEKFKLDHWVEGYLSFLLDVQKKNKRTVVDIRCTMKKIICYRDENFPQKDIWDLTFKEFLKWINGSLKSGRTIKTLSKEISHIRCFLNYMLRNERCDRNVLEGFHLQDKNSTEPEFLEYEEVERLISVLPVRKKDDRRDRLMVLLLYGCGLRTMELCNLNVRDVDIEHQELHIRQAKGDMERQMPVPDGVWIELQAYLVERKWKTGPLFRTPLKRKRMNQKFLSKVLSGFVKEAGISKKVTPKTLRHTFATHLMDKGVDLSIIASLMGHRSPSETGVYLHQLKGIKEEAIQKVKIFDLEKKEEF